MAKAKKSSSKAYLDHSLITYAPIDVILQAFRYHKDDIKGFAYILHKYDTKDTGELKEPHYHILLRLWSRRSLATVRRWFWCLDENGPVNTLNEPLGSVETGYAYLTHQYDPDKYQYSKDSIVVSDRKWFEVDYYANADSATLAYEMSLIGVNPYIIAKRFGRDFIYHQHDIYELRDRTIQHAQSSPTAKKKMEDILFEIYDKEELEI